MADEPKKPQTDDERKADEDKARKVAGYLRVLKAIKKQGWFWPGED